MQLLARLMMVGLCVAAAGCSAAHVQEPQASVTGVSLTEATPAGTRVQVTLEVHNPNDTVLPVKWAEYSVAVGSGMEFAFTDMPPVALPPRSTQTIALPAAFAIDESSLVHEQVSVIGRIGYQPPGEVRELMTQYRIPLPSVGFRKQIRVQSHSAVQ